MIERAFISNLLRINSLKAFISETIGWYGAVAILGAYIGLLAGVFSAHSYSYQLLNITGACAICFIAYIKKAYEPAALNAVWALIGIIALAGLMLW